MTPTSQRESAKIYQFPIRTRPAVGDHRDARPARPLPSCRAMPAPSFGSGWYHDSAIRRTSAAPGADAVADATSGSRSNQA